MNERIESYLKQHHCRDYFNTYGETIDDEHYFMYREEVEGLIELIVRECAKVAFNDWCEGTNEESSQMAILKHFGVEE
jgi:hypothetical protein